MPSEREKAIVLVSAEEAEAVPRAVRKWLNGCPQKPNGMRLDFEWLNEDSGLTLSTMQTPYKVRRYIDGTYQAQYQFKLIFRTMATSADERLAADEVLNRFGAWAEENKNSLELGAGRRVISVARDTNAALAARYEGNIEDHEISVKIIYEVI